MRCLIAFCALLAVTCALNLEDNRPGAMPDLAQIARSKHGQLGAPEQVNLQTNRKEASIIRHLAQVSNKMSPNFAYFSSQKCNHF